MEGEGQFAHGREARSGGPESIKVWSQRVEDVLAQAWKIETGNETVEDGVAQAAVELARMKVNEEQAGLRHWMTGLYSRQAILDIADHLCDLESTHSHWEKGAAGKTHTGKIHIALGDLDRFSQVAKPGGRVTSESEQKADNAIKITAQLLQQTAKGKGVYWGAMGGEEFLVVGKDMGREEFVAFVEECRIRVQDNLAATADIPDVIEGGRATMSFGVVSVPARPETDVQAAVKAADEALLRAKQNGRNRVEVLADEEVQDMEKKQKNSRMPGIRKFEADVPRLVNRTAHSYEQELRAALGGSEEHVPYSWEQARQRIQVREFINKMAVDMDKAEQNRMMDSLTGVYHKGAFAQVSQQFIEVEQEHGHKVGLILVDLNRFKDVNDFLNHETGDKVLQETVVMMREELQAAGMADAQIGRWRPGGQFAIVIPHMEDMAAIEELARTMHQNMRDALGERSGAQDLGRRATVSILVKEADTGGKIAQEMQTLDQLQEQARNEMELGPRDCVISQRPDGSQLVVGNGYYRWLESGKPGEEPPIREVVRTSPSTTSA